MYRIESEKLRNINEMEIANVRDVRTRDATDNNNIKNDNFAYTYSASLIKYVYKCLFKQMVTGALCWVRFGFNHIAYFAPSIAKC